MPPVVVLQPKQARVADISYIQTRSGWLYLAVVLDLFARKVLGWAMAPDMQATLVCRALQPVIVQRQPQRHTSGVACQTRPGRQYESQGQLLGQRRDVLQA